MTDISNTPKSESPVLTKVFLDHPRAVGESYVEHFMVSGRFFLIMMRLAGAALLHAFIPCMCEKTVSSRIIELSDGMRKRQATAE